MLIQAYNEGEVKIFYGELHLCSFKVSPPLKPLVDEHLHLLHMRRRTKWKDVSWGSYAIVRFTK
jgi:hypothetical protein